MTMVNLLSKFTDEDHFLSMGAQFNWEEMTQAINDGLVKECTPPKGSTGWRAWSLTPKGRLYLRKTGVTNDYRKN